MSINLNKQVSYLKRLQTGISKKIRKEVNLRRLRQGNNLLESVKHTKSVHIQAKKCIKSFLKVTESVENIQELSGLRKELAKYLK